MGGQTPGGGRGRDIRETRSPMVHGDECPVPGKDAQIPRDTEDETSEEHGALRDVGDIARQCLGTILMGAPGVQGMPRHPADPRPRA